VLLEFRDIRVDLSGRRAVTRHGRAVELRVGISSHIVAVALPGAPRTSRRPARAVPTAMTSFVLSRHPA
jgi:hypothetical protein